MIKCKNSCPLEKFEGCCHCCPDFEQCNDKCPEFPNICGESTFDEESGLVALEQQQMAVITRIADICMTKKKLEALEKDLKDKLKEAMEQYGVKSLDNDILKITYIAATTANFIDSAKLKKLHPDIAAECTKTSAKSAYIKVEVKGGEK